MSRNGPLWKRGAAVRASTAAVIRGGGGVPRSLSAKTDKELAGPGPRSHRPFCAEAAGDRQSLIFRKQIQRPPFFIGEGAATRALITYRRRLPGSLPDSCGQVRPMSWIGSTGFESFLISK